MVTDGSEADGTCGRGHDDAETDVTASETPSLSQQPTVAEDARFEDRDAGEPCASNTGRLVQALLSSANRRDPAHLMGMGAPPDEYESIVRRLVVQLQAADSVDATAQMIKRAFTDAFRGFRSGVPAISMDDACFRLMAEDVWVVLDE